MGHAQADDHRSRILDEVKTYGDAKYVETDFLPGETPVPVSGKVLRAEDLVAMVDASLDGWLTAGRFTEKFERALARYVGVRGAVFVNSGSSANLVALSALTSPKLGKRRLVEGDEVLTVAMGFPTTVNPIIQNRLTPVLVDVELGTYDANPDLLAQAIGPRTKAIMMAHTLGNPFDLDAVKALVQGAPPLARGGLLRRARLHVRRQEDRQLRGHRDRQLLPGAPHHHRRGRGRLRALAADQEAGGVVPRLGPRLLLPDRLRQHLPEAVRVAAGGPAPGLRPQVHLQPHRVQPEGHRHAGRPRPVPVGAHRRVRRQASGELPVPVRRP